MIYGKVRASPAAEPPSDDKWIVDNKPPPKLLIAVAGGTGFGYVSGETEGGNVVKQRCLGSSLVVIQPEIGYYVSSQISIGASVRLGFPVGANVKEHATTAPSVLFRVRYALDVTGDRLRFMGQAGIGAARYTTKLDGSTPGMDTDTVAHGPVLLGAGIGYTHQLSSKVFLVSDLSGLVGVPTSGALAELSPKFNKGFGADLSIGVQISF